ncbi:MAG TPA: UvrD-helicase domain-containing protein [Acidisarcina sp.]
MAEVAEFQSTAKSRFATPLADADARLRALDVSKSFLVQAPAGSGKTELLTNRFLKLLSVVDEPEQVLAITFTRGATAEMRSRILDKLRHASIGAGVSSDGTNTEEQSPARAAMERSRERGWALLDQPQRLNIQTIDSLCLSIAHRMPMLARLGGNLQPTENAGPFYDLAAQRTFEHLGGTNAELHSALAAVLTLRDNNLANCEELLAEMLRQRDQWGHLFLFGENVDWDGVRGRLEEPFQREIGVVLQRAHQLLSRDPELAAELMDLAQFVRRNGGFEDSFQVLESLMELPGPTHDFLDHWTCLGQLLINKAEGWRKKHKSDHGFPNRVAASEKARLSRVVETLQTMPGALEALCSVLSLPTPHYSDAQWQTLRHLFTTLRYAVAELKVIFAERNAVDFAELGLAAEMVLRTPDAVPAGDGLSDTTPGSAQLPTEQALAIGDRLRHLLVDEFQDTSRRQHQLLIALLRGWDNCDGRTCFLVGDPMQSIYLFRQAEVELFHKVSREGLNCDGAVVELENLQLRSNFRSHSGLVEPLNSFFEQVFGRDGRVAFTGSVASRGGGDMESVHVHPYILPSTATVEEKHAARRLETKQVLKIVEEHWPQVEQARLTPGTGFTIGVLVRAKRHAISIAAALRARGYHFRSVDLETLGERQEILDLVALTRALAHPMDRIAWLSILRAPWCGLELGDLHALCGTDSRETAHIPVLQLLRGDCPGLSEDGRARVAATREVLLAALEPRYRNSATLSFASWIERTWHGLGGHRCVDAVGLENANTFFRMLDELDAGANGVTTSSIDSQLARLFAQPDPEADERAGIKLMTIHKSKGLEFDVVIVPGLERATGNDRHSLICWLQRSFAAGGAGPDGVEEVLVAPISEKGTGTSRLYKWVQTQKSKREVEERRRLLYVACTRASKELHLLGAATAKAGVMKPLDAKSLLATAWVALEPVFAAKVSSWPVGSRAADGGAAVLVMRDAGDGAELHGIDLAAAAAGPEAETQAAGGGMRIRRLPTGLNAEVVLPDVTVPVTSSGVAGATRDEPGKFSRPEGSLAARALGTTVHALFERAARELERGATAAELRRAVGGWRKQARSLLRNNGLVAEGRGAGQIGETSANVAVDAVRAALDDAAGLWILSPHREARSETAWTGVVDGGIRTLRVDRMFRAGSEPLSLGNDCLWIVDYKTATRSGPDLAGFLKEERLRYKGQLEMYGRMLRLARGSGVELRLALYYPRMQQLLHWPL